MDIHKFYRAIKALARRAGPLGVLPRTVTINESITLMYQPLAGPKPRVGMAVQWTAEIEGIGVETDPNPEILLNRLAKRIPSEKK